ncbi:hypothetical protein ACSVIJ_21850, partial [Pseudomonas sp. NCHU5208]|uniref:hypothetical protein n=1 Tax=Pseudomonas sp. NCHU5208 TaxID=3451354 RepID=UPI003F9675EC
MNIGSSHFWGNAWLTPGWRVCVLFGVLDAASVCSETSCFAPSGDSLFFEIGLPPSAKKSKQK